MIENLQTENSNSFLRPRLRLFLSVDIVGSTAFKQNNHNNFISLSPASKEAGQSWFNPIANFFRDIEISIIQEWDLSIKKYGWNIGEVPKFWKAAGDEVIYTKILQDYRQVYSTIEIWSAMIKGIRKNIRIKTPSLDLKLTAWLAGFPINNSEIVINSFVTSSSKAMSDDSNYQNMRLLEQHYADLDKSGMVLDYVGPSIDTGFRISALSNPRKFVISADLTLLLARAASEISPNPLLQLYYDGRFPLKGVLGGAPYPIFWVDMLDDDPVVVKENVLRNPQISGPVEFLSAFQFCQSYINDNSSFIFVPYICGDEGGKFSSPPSGHIERLNSLTSMWKLKKESIQNQEDALAGKDAPLENGAGEENKSLLNEDDISDFQIESAS